MGVPAGRGGAFVVPSLKQHRARELGKEAAGLTEKRKAREARGKGAGKCKKGAAADASAGS